MNGDQPENRRLLPIIRRIHPDLFADLVYSKHIAGQPYGQVILLPLHGSLHQQNALGLLRLRLRRSSLGIRSLVPFYIHLRVTHEIKIRKLHPVRSLHLRSRGGWSISSPVWRSHHSEGVTLASRPTALLHTVRARQIQRCHTPQHRGLLDEPPLLVPTRG